jgi:predicted histone-like DNA-binding protein
VAIKIKSISSKILQNQAAPPKFYAIVELSDKTNIDELSALNADKSTVSRPDVYAVIMATLETVMHELSSGRSVHLGKLGSFSISVSSNAVDTADAVSASVVKKARVLYRPGLEIKNMLKTLKYEKKA